VSKINWGRVLIGGVIAASICFLTDGLLHEKLLAADWKTVYDNLRISPTREHGVSVFYFALFDLGRGLVSIFLYALMRKQFGPGPKTAAMAGVAAWIAFSFTGPAQFIPLGFYSNALWIKVAAFQLVTSILGTIAGAALYKEDALKPAHQ
jgi:hypothetical protein